MPSAAAQARLKELFAKRDAAESRPEPHTTETWRREWEADALLEVPAPGTRIRGLTANGVGCEWIDVPQADAKAGAVLWLHGGGYEGGSPITHRQMASYLSLASGLPVLVPDYRLSPEHPFPAARDDAIAAFDYLIALGYPETQIVTGGDSAGGGLALSLMLTLRERGRRQPAAAALMSPWTDLTASGATYAEFAALDPISTQQGLAATGRRYAGSLGTRDPVASPMFADPHGLPPLLIQAGGIESLLDDSRVFARQAEAAGVPVTLSVYEGLWHVFQFHPDIPETQAAFAEAGAFFRAHLG